MMPNEYPNIINLKQQNQIKYNFNSLQFILCQFEVKRDLRLTYNNELDQDIIYYKAIIYYKMIINKIIGRFSTSIILDFQDLKKGKNLENLIEQAYGPKGLGILFVKQIPGYSQLRNKTLPLFTKLANLPQETLKKYIRPELFHAYGWSCGVQQFHGKYDTSKGSFYLNSVTDQSHKILPQHQKLYSPSQKIILSGKNKWVDQIPEIQQNVKLLSKVMISTGALLSRQIDSYAFRKVQGYPKNQLQKIIQEGHNHVGRILHYFPLQKAIKQEDNWCGWHNDHGSLTALTSAMYVNHEGKEVEIKSQSGGLYAKNRFGQMKRISIPKDMLAFQLGECCQILTGGQLEATPHCVVASDQVVGKGIGRNTYALFMEPNHLQVLKCPQGISQENITNKVAYKVPQLKERWINGMYFKDFHAKTLEYYS